MYSTYVLQELRWLVAEKKVIQIDLQIHKARKRRKIKAQLDNRLNTLFQNGLTIYTALDPDKQAHDEEK